MNMKKFAFLAAIALTFGVLAALPGTAQALTIGDNTNYLGSIGDPEPASPSDEEGYINILIAQAPGSPAITIGGHLYTRSNVSCGACPAAEFNSRVTNTQGFTFDANGNVVVDLGTGGFTYLLGKYDGPNGASAVWNVQGLTGIVTIPPTGFGNFGLSHWSLFGPGNGGGVPDGGTTVMLLGAALGALGMARRFLNR
jgi:hypothetical protein